MLSQKLASGEYLEGQAYEDCIDTCSTTTPFMEEVPQEGDIVACLCQYYQRRIGQCVVIGKPPPHKVLGEMFSDVVWDEGSSADTAHAKYRALKRLIMKQGTMTLTDYESSYPVRRGPLSVARTGGGR